MSAPFRIVLADAERLAMETIADALMPPPPIDLERFAVEHLVFPAGETFAGPYDAERFAFWSEPLAACSPNHPCRMVTIRKSAQLGGTVLSLIVAYAALHHGLGRIGVTHPTDANGTMWVRGKFDRYLPAVVRAALVPPGKEGGNSLSYKSRKDGRATLEIAGANSPSDLSQKTWDIQVQDDLSKWADNPLAGDPETSADSRSKAVPSAKILKISTPTLAGECRISRAYDEGTRHVLHLPCPHCRGLQPLRWEVFRDTIDPDDPASAHFVCVETVDAETGELSTGCGGRIEEHHRRWMMHPANGMRWIARHPERATWHCSYDVWTAYSPLTSWEVIARDWLAARGKPTAEQGFFNDTLGRPYEGDHDAPITEALIARSRGSRARGIVPLGFPFLFVGVDVQQDRLEWQLVAYGHRWRRHVVEYGVIPHAVTERDPVFARLDALLASTWTSAHGVRLGVDHLAIDANYETDIVMDWVRRHTRQRVTAVRGVSGWQRDIIAAVGERRETDGKRRRYGGRLFNVAVDLLKLWAYRAFKIERAADGPDPDYYVTFAAGLDTGETAYFDGLTSNRRVERVRAGKRVWGWELPKGRADEPLDTWNYAEVAARKWGFAGLTDADFAREEARRLTPRAGAQADLEDLFHPAPAVPAPPAPAAAAPASPPAARAADRSSYLGDRRGYL